MRQAVDASPGIFKEDSGLVYHDENGSLKHMRVATVPLNTDGNIYNLDEDLR